MRYHRRKISVRTRGSAVVELAVTLPVITTLVVGSIELCHLLHLQHTLQVTAQECARVAAHRNATDSDVVNRGNDILGQRSVVAGQVTTTPTSIENLVRGTRITVRVSAPVSQNSLITGRFYAFSSVDATTTLVKSI